MSEKLDYVYVVKDTNRAAAEAIVFLSGNVETAKKFAVNYYLEGADRGILDTRFKENSYVDKAFWLDLEKTYDENPKERDWLFTWVQVWKFKVNYGDC